MATAKNITMKQYNGTDYDTLYPKTIAEQVEGIYSKEDVLSNGTKALYGLADNAVPDDAFAILASKNISKLTVEAITTSKQWTAPKAQGQLFTIYVVGGGAAGVSGESGSGGGSGYIIRKTVTIPLGETVSCVCGAGGTTSGENGGATSFGDYATANGGQGTDGGAGGGGGRYNNGGNGGEFGGGGGAGGNTDIMSGGNGGKYGGGGGQGTSVSGENNGNSGEYAGMAFNDYWLYSLLINRSFAYLGLNGKGTRSCGGLAGHGGSGGNGGSNQSYAGGGGGGGYGGNGGNGTDQQLGAGGGGGGYGGNGGNAYGAQGGGGGGFFCNGADGSSAGGGGGGGFLSDANGIAGGNGGILIVYFKEETA